ncbi:hypothetical protein Tco_1490447 [Tanacetum coccineum]
MLTFKNNNNNNKRNNNKATRQNNNSRGPKGKIPGFQLALCVGVLGHTGVTGPKLRRMESVNSDDGIFVGASSIGHLFDWPPSDDEGVCVRTRVKELSTRLLYSTQSPLLGELGLFCQEERRISFQDVAVDSSIELSGIDLRSGYHQLRVVKKIFQRRIAELVQFLGHGDRTVRVFMLDPAARFESVKIGHFRKSAVR